jgi:hypothetical protein
MVKIILLLLSLMFCNKAVSETPIDIVSKYIHAHQKGNWKEKYSYISSYYQNIIPLEMYIEVEKNMDLFAKECKTFDDNYIREVIGFTYGADEGLYIFSIIPFSKFTIKEIKTEDDYIEKQGVEGIVSVSTTFQDAYGRDDSFSRDYFLKKEEQKWKIINPYFEKPPPLSYFDPLPSYYTLAVEVLKKYFDNLAKKNIKGMYECLSEPLKKELEGYETYKKKWEENFNNKEILQILKVVDIVIFHEKLSEDTCTLVKEPLKGYQIDEDIFRIGVCLLGRGKYGLEFTTGQYWLIKINGEWKITDGGILVMESKKTMLKKNKINAKDLLLKMKEELELVKEIKRSSEFAVFDYNRVFQVYSKIKKEYPVSQECKEAEKIIEEVKELQIEDLFNKAKRYLSSDAGTKTIIQIYNKLKKEYPDSKWTKELEKLMDKETEKNIK